MMNRNNSQWSRRIFLSAVILCLALTSFGVSPARAQDLEPAEYEIRVSFFPLPNQICVKDKVKVTVQFMIVHTGEMVKLTPFKGKVSLRADLGKVAPPESPQISTRIDQMASFNFTYTAPSERTIETIYAVVRMDGLKDGKEEKSFEVQKGCRRNVHGTTNLNQVLGSMMSGGPWQPVAMYDISGTIQVDENGGLRGEGTANNFVDTLWTGQGWENATCSVSGPREGRSTVALVADPDAWAQEGEIDLQFNIESMQVNSITLSCCIDGDCHSSPLPGFTIAAFDLKFDPLSTQGGTTDLEFHFPAAHVPLKMELIVSPEEAGA